MTTTVPPDDRRVGGRHLARILGDWRGNDAAYAGLTSRIRLLILDGRLPLHTRLPAERELAETLDVSRTTVAAAYERLRADGFLRSRRGAGTWTDLPAAVGDALPRRRHRSRTRRAERAGGGAAPSRGHRGRPARPVPAHAWLRS